jgi:hypothetical protein
VNIKTNTGNIQNKNYQEAKKDHHHQNSYHFMQQNATVLGEFDFASARHQPARRTVARKKFEI